MKLCRIRVGSVSPLRLPARRTKKRPQVRNAAALLGIQKQKRDNVLPPARVPGGKRGEEMRKARKVVAIAFGVVAALSVGQSVGADPIGIPDSAIVVTGGQYAVRSGVDTFTLTSAIGELVQNSGATPPKDFASTCSPCAAGDVVNLSFRNTEFDAAGFNQYVDLGTG